MRLTALVAGLAPRTAPLIGFLCAATALPCSTASAATTTWTNPGGGAWSDPLNWSAGVPQAGDAVVLPGLDGDGYTITVNGTVACASLDVAATLAGGPITLTGGSIGVTSRTVIGGSAGDGALILDGASLNSLLLDIGVDASGALDLRGGSSVGAALARVGDGGEGRLTVGSDAKVFGIMWILESGSRLEMALAPSTDKPIDVTDFTQGGILEISLTPDFDIPTSGQTLIKTMFGLGGAFSSVTIPSIRGYELPLVIGPTVMTIPAFDPILEATILAPNLPFVVGFDSDLWVEEIRYSGAVTTSCWWNPCAYEWAVTSGNAAFEGDVLRAFGPGPVTVEATRESNGMQTVASTTVEALAESPFRIRRLAVAPDGAAPGNTVEWSPRGPRASDDGRFTVFAHRSVLGTGPACDPHPTQPDILIHDASTGSVECVSVGVPTAPNANPDISGDGRFVVFTNGSGSASQVWLHDRWAGVSTRLSQSPDGQPGNAGSAWPCLSRDGSVVVFTSKATNLGADVPSEVEQVYLYERMTGQISLISKDASGEAGSAPSGVPSVSADGRLVAFSTTAPNLMDGVVGQHIVLFDRSAGTLEIVDRATDGTLGNGIADLPILSASGRHVLLTSRASNLDASDVDSKEDVFLRDRMTGVTTWVSPDFPSGPIPMSYIGTALTDDGSSVVYAGSFPDGAGTTFRLLRRWVETGESDWVAASPWGEPSPVAGSLTPFTASDSQVLFFAPQFNLVPFVTSMSTQPLARLYGPSQQGDLNGDGVVNAGDLSILLAEWGSIGSTADLDADGVVGAGDLAILLAAWSV